MYINSSLVSAQNRERFYCFNGDCEQPKDRGILLRDILESGVVDREKSYCLKHQMGNARDYFKKRHTQIAFEPIRIGTIENAAKNPKHDSQEYRVYSSHGKSVALCGNGGGIGAKTGLYTVPMDCDVIITDNSLRCQRRDEKHSTVQGTHVNFENGKTQTLSTSHIPRILQPNASTDKGKIIYTVKDGQITIKDNPYPINLPDGNYIIRKLTAVECERLQTLPDNYTAGISDTQRYKCLGNGWTAEVIIHILRSILKDIPRDEKLLVLSMYDGIATGRYCLEQLGFTNIEYHAYEIDKYAKQIELKNYPDIIQHGDAFEVRNEDWRI